MRAVRRPALCRSRHGAVARLLLADIPDLAAREAWADSSHAGANARVFAVAGSRGGAAPLDAMSSLGSPPRVHGRVPGDG